MPQINDATVALVKEFEGLRLKAYHDSVGVWTIGYGHSERAGYGIVPVAGMAITEAEAEALLREGLERFGRGLARLLTRKPTDNQFGAMVSLAYNIGLGAFRKSTCLKRFNSGNAEGAAEALTWFNKAGGKVLRGLVRRRESERDLFLDEAPEVVECKPDAEKTAVKSTTIWSSVGAAVSSIGSMFAAIQSLEDSAQIAVIVCAFGTLAFLAWIFRERVLKLGNGH